MIARKALLEGRLFPGPGRIWKAASVAVIVTLVTTMIVSSGVAIGMRVQTLGSATLANIPAAGQLVIVRGGHLHVLSPDGRQVRVIGEVRGFSLAQVSPDRQNVALVSADLRRVASMSLVDGSIRVVAEDQHSGHTNVRWSTDSKRLYFIRIPQRASLDDPWSMHAVSMDGSLPIDLTPRNNATFDQLLPLPDGRILFESQTRRGVVEAMTMFVADANGRNERPLLGDLPKGKSCLNPDLSADGSRLLLACSSGGSEAASLIVVDLSTAKTKEIPSPTVLPRWSATGVILGLNWFGPGECPEQIVKVDPRAGTTQPIYTEAGGFLRISGIVGDLALVEASSCNDGRSAAVGRVFWLDAQGRTFELGEASQARWLGGR